MTEAPGSQHTDAGGQPATPPDPTTDPTPQQTESGAPGDREYHLRRVAAAWPETFSAHTLQRLARMLGPGTH